MSGAILSVVCALGAALCLGVGMAYEHRGATRAPARPAAHPGLVVDLLRSTHWRLGLVLSTAGYGLQVVAFGSGRLLVIEPLMTMALVVALAAGGLMAHRPLTRHQWLAVIGTTAAVVVFTATTAPSAGRETAPVTSWVPWFAGIGVPSLLVLVVTPRWRAGRRAGALATCAGCIYGLTDALTKTVADAVAHHGGHVLVTWPLYALVVVGAAGFMGQQSAYHASRLADAQPALSVSEPLVGSLIGITILREQVHVGALLFAVDAVAVVAMVLGVVSLGRLADRERPPGEAAAGPPAETPPVPAAGTAALGTAIAEAEEARAAERRQR